LRYLFYNYTFIQLHKVMTLGEKDGRGGSEDVVAAQRTNSPLSGTAEERMPEAELKRRRSGSQIRASAPPSQQSVATGSFSTTTRPSAVTTNPASATTTVALAAAAVSVGRARSIDECDVTQSAGFL
jgi:hypothetical protein